MFLEELGRDLLFRKGWTSQVEWGVEWPTFTSKGFPVWLYPHLTESTSVWAEFGEEHLSVLVFADVYALPVGETPVRGVATLTGSLLGEFRQGAHWDCPKVNFLHVVPSGGSFKHLWIRNDLHLRD